MILKQHEIGALPKAIGIGPQKTGTTWIQRYFEWRNDICLPNGTKETFFFDRYYSKGIKWYSSYFSHKNFRNSIAIEIAPTYFHCSEAPARIKKELGDIFIICTLREPISRTYSLYLHMLRYGITNLNFKDAVKKYPEILSSSMYSFHLKRWFDYFEKEKILILFLEEFTKSPNKYAENLCKHLKISFKPIPDSLLKPINEAALPSNFLFARIANSTANFLRSYKLHKFIEIGKKIGMKDLLFGKPGDKPLPQLNETDFLWLKDNLDPEIDRLENLLGINLQIWKKAHSH